MKENLYRDNLEEFFQQNLENQNSDASRDGWDTPDEMVWDKIKEEVAKPVAAPKRIIRLGWLAAASILFLGVLFFMLNTNQKVNDISDELKKHDQELQELKKGNAESQIAVEGITDKIDVAPSKSTNDPTSIADPSIDKISTPDSQNDLVGASVDETSNLTTSTQPSTNENTSTQITNEQSANPELQEQSITGLGADGREQSNGQRSGEGNVAGTDISVPPIGTTEQEFIPENAAQLPLVTPSQKNDGQGSPEVVEESIASNPVENLKEDQEEAGENIVVEDESIERKIFTPIESLNSVEIIVESENFTMQKPTEPMPWKAIKQSENKAGFYAGLLVAPTLNSRRITYPGPRPARAPFNLSENTKTSIDYGLRLGYVLNKNWSIESGINYKNIVFEASHAARIVHRPTQERRNADGNFDSDYRTTLQTSFGTLEADVALTRNADTDIADNDEIELSLTTKHQLESVNIPVVAVYRNELGDKLNLAVRGGLSGNILIDQNIEVLRARSDREGVTLKNTRMGQKLQDLQKDYINWTVSAGLEFEASENMRISIEPTFTKSLSPVFNFRDVKSYPTTASVVAGVNYFF